MSTIVFLSGLSTNESTGVKQGDLCHNYKSSNKNDYRKLNLIVIGIQSSIHSHYLDLKQYNVVFTLEQGKVQG